MKKLVIVCLVLLLVGGGLAAGGLSAGGRLYGSYYDGALHPVTEAWDDALDAVDRYTNHDLFRRGLHYESGYAADGSFHSGWFDEDHGLSDFPAGGGYTDGGLTEGDLPLLPAPEIRELEFSFEGGSFRIEEGADFDVQGGAVREESIHDGVWELTLRRENSAEAVITLPRAVYDKIECNVGAATLTIGLPLAAAEAEFHVGAGALTAVEPLDMQALDVECGLGSVTLPLAGGKTDYGYEIAAAVGGSVTLDGSELAGGGLFGTHRASRDGARMLDLTVGAGSIHLTTGETAESGQS